jgi:hypothetical protein
MDRETSRPAKRWEAPGEEGDPPKGPRQEGVAPVEIPDALTQVSRSEPRAARDRESHAVSKKPHKKTANGG